MRKASSASPTFQKGRGEGIVFLLLILSMTLCAVIVVTPLLHSSSPGGEGFIRLAFSLVCHQRPERSLSWGGVAFPVCSRCLGFYFGFPVVLSLFLLFPRVEERLPLFLTVIGAVLLFFLSKLFQPEGGFLPWYHSLRWLSGAFIAIISAQALCRAR